MRLRARLFGEALTARQRCSGCGEDFEIDFTAEQVGLAPRRGRREAARSARRPPELPPPRFRSPRRLRRRHDRGGGGAGGVDSARELLAARTAPEAPSAARRRLAETLEALDPAADTVVEADCPQCGAAQELRLDPAAFVWEELAARAPRILRDVADLARIYHWSEREILAMPASRRAFYLAAA